MTAIVRRIVISVVAAIAIAGIWWAFSSAETKRPSQPEAIESVSPPEGDLDLRQVQIGVDLAAGYTGMLFLDGAEIPADDIHVEPALNSISLKPQPDSQFRTLRPGLHRATVLYWPTAQGRSQEKSYTWHFTLH